MEHGALKHVEFARFCGWGGLGVWVVAAESASWVCALHATSCNDLCLICSTTLLIKKFDCPCWSFSQNGFQLLRSIDFRKSIPSWSVWCWYIVCVCCLIVWGEGISQTLHSVIFVLPVTVSCGAGLEMATTICFMNLVFRIETETDFLLLGDLLHNTSLRKRLACTGRWRAIIQTSCVQIGPRVRFDVILLWS